MKQRESISQSHPTSNPAESDEEEGEGVEEEVEGVAESLNFQPIRLGHRGHQDLLNGRNSPCHSPRCQPNNNNINDIFNTSTSTSRIV